jgi:hypothetical protein
MTAYHQHLHHAAPGVAARGLAWSIAASRPRHPAAVSAGMCAANRSLKRAFGAI